MCAPLRVSVVHVVAGQAEDLVGAQQAPDHRQGGAAEVAGWAGPMPGPVGLLLPEAAHGSEAADVFLRRGSDLFILGFVDVPPATRAHRMRNLESRSHVELERA